MMKKLLPLVGALEIFSRRILTKLCLFLIACVAIEARLVFSQDSHQPARLFGLGSPRDVAFSPDSVFPARPGSRTAGGAGTRS
jgi:hypothetical protein